MPSRLDYILEAEKRGILPPEMKPYLDEARKRGLIPAKPEEPEPSLLESAGKRVLDAAKLPGSVVLPEAAREFVEENILEGWRKTARSLVDFGRGLEETADHEYIAEKMGEMLAHPGLRGTVPEDRLESLREEEALRTGKIPIWKVAPPVTPFGKKVEVDPGLAEEQRAYIAEHYAPGSGKSLEDVLAERSAANVQRLKTFKEKALASDYVRPEGIKGTAADAIQMIPGMTGFALGKIPGTAFMGAQIAGGEYDKLTSEGVDPETAMKAAVASAAGQAPLEALGFLRVLKFWQPGASTAKIFRGVGEGAAAEFITETLQSLPSEAAEIWAKSQGDNPQVKVDNFLDGLYELAKRAPRVLARAAKEEGAPAALVGGFFGGMGAGVMSSRGAERGKRDESFKEIEAGIRFDEEIDRMVPPVKMEQREISEKRFGIEPTEKAGTVQAEEGVTPPPEPGPPVPPPEAGPSRPDSVSVDDEITSAIEEALKGVPTDRLPFLVEKFGERYGPYGREAVLAELESRREATYTPEDEAVSPREAPAVEKAEKAEPKKFPWSKPEEPVAKTEPEGIPETLDDGPATRVKIIDERGKKEKEPEPSTAWWTQEDEAIEGIPDTLEDDEPAKPAAQPEKAEFQDVPVDEVARKSLWDAYQKTKETGGRARLSDLRKESGLSRPEFDEAMLAMQKRGDLVMYNLDDPNETGPDDDAAAISILGKKRHIAYFEESAKQEDRLPTAASGLDKPAEAAKPDLIYTKSGSPYKTEWSAKAQAKRVGGSVVEVDGGWAIQSKVEVVPKSAGESVTKKPSLESAFTETARDRTGYVPIHEIRQASGMDKAEFDKAIAEAAKKGEIALHPGNPAEFTKEQLDEAYYDDYDGERFLTASWRGEEVDLSEAGDDVIVKAIGKREADLINGDPVRFNEARQKGFTPPSPDNTPVFKYGEEPKRFSKEDVKGYHWGPKEISNIEERGNSLDMPGDINPFGQSGSTSTPWGGYVYTHRDPIEAEGIMEWNEDGAIYEITGKAADRKNPGLVSAGSLDDIERLYPVDEIASFKKIGEWVDGEVKWIGKRPEDLQTKLREKIANDSRAEKETRPKPEKPSDARYRKIVTAKSPYADLYKRIAKHGTKIAVADEKKLAELEKKANRKFGAAYQRSSNKIWLNDAALTNSTDEQIARTIAHESIHAVINNEVLPDPVRKKKLYADLGKFISEVESEYGRLSGPGYVKQVVEIARKKPQEIVTYGLTHPGFARWLDSIKVPGASGKAPDTLWQKLKAIILKVVGADMSRSKLDELSEILDKHLEMRPEGPSGLVLAANPFADPELYKSAYNTVKRFFDKPSKIKWLFDKDKPNLGLIKKTLSLPIYKFARHPQLNKLWEAANDSVRDKYETLREIIYSDPEGGVALNDEMRRWRKKNPKPGAFWDKWIIESDRDGPLEKIVVDEGKYYVYDKDKDRYGIPFDTEREAELAMFDSEVDRYFTAGGEVEGAEHLRLYRIIAARMFHRYRSAMDQLIKQYEEDGKGIPRIVYTGPDGKPVKIDLKAAVAMMGDLRGSYMPRIRKSGRIALIAKKDTGKRDKSGKKIYKTKHLEYFDVGKLNPNEKDWVDKLNWLSPAMKRYRSLKAKGLDVALTPAEKMPESVFLDYAGQLMATEALINEALEKIEAPAGDIFAQNNIEVVREGNDIVFKGVGVKGLARDIIEGYAKHERQKKITKSGSMEWSQWRIENVSNADDILSEMSGLFEEHIGYDPATKWKELLAANFATEFANLIKGRGARARMIKRGEQVGEDVVRGYEEDPILAITQAAQGLSGAEAKHRMAHKMIGVFTGQTESWRDHKKRVEKAGGKADWKAWRDANKARALDPKKQGRAYEDAKAYFRDMMRNDETMDRAIGVLRGLTAIKYLGLKPASAAVNLTAMATTVPATMMKHDIPLAKATENILAAGRDYAKFRIARRQATKHGLSKARVALFEQLEREGRHRAQYNKEALGVMKGKLGRAWGEFADVTMFMFGITEEFNRATTIAAAYDSLIEKGVASEEAMEKAVVITNEAHGVYGKTNLPSFARGSGLGPNILRSAYMFKTFTHHYFLNLADMVGKGPNGKRNLKAAAFLLLSNGFIAGLAASPFYDAGMLASWILEALGIRDDDDNPEEKLYSLVGANLGEMAETFTRTGAAGLVGIDLRGSLRTQEFEGLSNLLRKRGDINIFDILGAPGSLLRDVAEGADHLAHGRYWKGVEKISPLPMGLSNISKSVRESKWGTGVTSRDDMPVWYGTKKIETGLQGTVLRALSFNPTEVSVKREKIFATKKLQFKYDEKRDKIESRIKTLARRYSEGETITVELQKAMIKADEYNRKAIANGLAGEVPFMRISTIKRWFAEAVRPPKIELVTEQKGKR